MAHWIRTMEGEIINLDKVQFITTQGLAGSCWYGKGYFSLSYARFEVAVLPGEEERDSALLRDVDITLARTGKEEKEIVGSIMEFLRTSGGVWDEEKEVEQETYREE